MCCLICIVSPAALLDLFNLVVGCVGPTAPESDVCSDSSEMVKAIIQTVQNQDKVLKDLYTHLRWEVAPQLIKNDSIRVGLMGVQMWPYSFLLEETEWRRWFIIDY